MILERCSTRGYVNLPRLDRPIDGKEEVDELADETRGWTVCEDIDSGPAPGTTVVEKGSNRGSGRSHRSAITGRYVTEATAERHPDRAVTENG